MSAGGKRGLEDDVEGDEAVRKHSRLSKEAEIDVTDDKPSGTYEGGSHCIDQHVRSAAGTDSAGPSHTNQSRGGGDQEPADDLDGLDPAEVERVKLMEVWGELDGVAIYNADCQARLMTVLVQYSGSPDASGTTSPQQFKVDLPIGSNVQRLKRVICRHVDYIVTLGQVRMTTADGKVVEGKPGCQRLDSFGVVHGSVLQLQFLPFNEAPDEEVEPFPDGSQHTTEPLPARTAQVVRTNGQGGAGEPIPGGAGRDQPERQSRAGPASNEGPAGDAQGGQTGQAGRGRQQEGEQALGRGDSDFELEPEDVRRGATFQVSSSPMGKKRWTLEETLALIQRVKEVGYGNWKSVQAAVRTKDNMQCKDKWRAMQKTVEHGREQRGVKLTEEMLSDVCYSLKEHGHY